MSVYSKYFKFPVQLYVSALFIGLILANFISHPVNIASAGASIFNAGFFIRIAKTNCLLIMSIYIISVITRWYGYCVFIVNGFTLGCYLTWIFRSNVSLLWLLLPHGIFEIPIILSTAFIVTAGEEYIRKHVKTYFGMLGIHLIATLICAAIETYITPLFQVLVSIS